jgi:hypothetical protein
LVVRSAFSITTEITVWSGPNFFKSALKIIWNVVEHMEHL